MASMPEEVRAVLTALEAAGHEAWCVGGCVRDTLLGRTPEDWDVTTDALPEETMALFAPAAIPTGLQHGTVTVRRGGRGVEITTYRVDGAYHDHRRPDGVTFTRSLREDLARRDFTVNAMAMDLRGTLRDPFGGREDLMGGVLRCVGEPERRLEEDALRILRGLRFASVLGLAVHPDTAAAIHDRRQLLAAIAPERIWTELCKLLCGDNAAEVLRRFPDVVAVFWPEASAMVGFEQQNIHHCYDVWEHSLHALEAVPPDLILRCTMLLHDIGKVETFTVDDTGVGHFYGHGERSAALADDLLRRLRCANELRRRIVRLVAWHDRDIPRTERAVRRALAALGEEDLRRLIWVKRADNLAQAPEFRFRQQEIDRGEAILEDLLARRACVTLRDLEVDGRDLMALGFSGPAIGAALHQLLDRVIDGALPNEREALLAATEGMTREFPSQKNKG